jgi:hypothetical protein
MADRFRAAAETPGEVPGVGQGAAPSAGPQARDEHPGELRSWAIGDSASLRGLPRYLKTADPMPMLRPPDLVDVGEVGVVVAERALGQLAVRFRRGTFLLDSDQLTSPEGQT